MDLVIYPKVKYSNYCSSTFSQKDNYIDDLTKVFFYELYKYPEDILCIIWQTKLYYFCEILIKMYLLYHLYDTIDSYFMIIVLNIYNSF